MEAKSDIVVISGYGRGHWLAAEMKTLGLSVVLIDVSENIGRLPPEDIEGPLGFFQAENMPASFRSRLDIEDYSDLVEDGFVLWLKSGPLDLRGSHSAQLLAQNGIAEDVRAYVEQYDQWSPKQRAEHLKKWKNSPFAEVWFALLAHSLASPAATEAREAFDYGRPLPLFAPYNIRRVSRRGAEKSLEALANHGVQVLTNAKITDIAIRGREMLHVEIASSWSGVVGGECFVWALTSEETARFSNKFVDSLFSNGVLTSEWIWQRLRFEIGGSDSVLSSLPLKFLAIEDERLPWSHTNMMWVQKTVTPGLFDVWLRVPTVHRFQRSYHEELAREVAQNLKGRLPGCHVTLNEYPQEYKYDETVLGPARFQSFAPKALKKHHPNSFKNVHFDGPEFYEMIDWNGQIQYQQTLFEKVKAWKLERDIRVEKLRAKEQEKKR